MLNPLPPRVDAHSHGTGKPHFRRAANDRLPGGADATDPARTRRRHAVARCPQSQRSSPGGRQHIHTANAGSAGWRRPGNELATGRAGDRRHPPRTQSTIRIWPMCGRQTGGNRNAASAAVDADRASNAGRSNPNLLPAPLPVRQHVGVVLNPADVPSWGLHLKARRPRCISRGAVSGRRAARGRSGVPQASRCRRERAGRFPRSSRCRWPRAGHWSGRSRTRCRWRR